MNLAQRIRTMDRRLRVMLIATALLIVPGIGQLIAVRNLNTAGRESDLAIFFMFVAIFVVPTSLILSAATLAVLRREWRAHQTLFLLGLLNGLISLNLVWFFFAPCSWAQVFGLALRTCH